VYILTQVRDRRYFKIGYAKNIEKRLIDLQTGNPDELSIILTLDGGQKEETILHRKFYTQRIRRNSEWFNLLGEDLLFLAEQSIQGIGGLPFHEISRIPNFREWFGLLDQRDILDRRWSWLPDQEWIKRYQDHYDLPVKSKIPPLDFIENWKREINFNWETHMIRHETIFDRIRKQNGLEPIYDR